VAKFTSNVSAYLLIPGTYIRGSVELSIPKKPVAVSRAGLTYIKGDATEPRGQGPRVIAHIVNDKTPMWGGRGFASYLRQKWPGVQDDFKSWAFSVPGRLSLGEVHKTVARDDIHVVHMIAQHGYGSSSMPRIRYMALKKCLEQLSTIANQEKATIHLPRIGCGEAGGRWDMVEELIEEALCANGINVTIYDLPRSVKETAKESLSLFDEQPV
jgi:O-acetyl-ADP-ribose deacetylase (regulator of RNase III)